MGLTLATGRLGSYGADKSPTWFGAAYAQGWQAPLLIAAGVVATSFVAAGIPLQAPGRAR